MRSAGCSWSMRLASALCNKPHRLRVLITTEMSGTRSDNARLGGRIAADLCNTRAVCALSLRDDVADDGAGNVRQTEIASTIAVGQLRVIDAQQMQDRRVQIVDVDRLVDRLESKVVRRAVDHA